MSKVTEFASLEMNFELAEAVVIARKELTVSPKYQMREQMDHSVIDDYAENLDKLPPVRVFDVDGELVLVDGFHRYFAHERAEAEDVPAKVIKGTEEDAMKYAMVANFAHLQGGSKPSKDDQKKAIQRLCVSMMDSFGYDSQSVVPALKAVGVTASDRHMQGCTAEIRTLIDDKRDTRILEMHQEGVTQKEIAKTLGCSVRTVIRRVKTMVTDAHSAEVSPPEEATSGNTESDDESPFLDEELDESPVVNPAEAQSRALAQFDDDLEESNAESPGQVRPDVINNDYEVKEERTPVRRLLGDWKAQGKEQFEKEVQALSEEERQELVAFASFVARRIA